jgi:hypothetical protein
MSSSKMFWDALRKHEAQAADAHDAHYERTCANPYYSAYAWWFDDAMGHMHGPYETQRAATHALLQYMVPRKPWFQRFADWIAPLDDEGKYG